MPTPPPPILFGRRMSDITGSIPNGVRIWILVPHEHVSFSVSRHSRARFRYRATMALGAERIWTRHRSLPAALKSLETMRNRLVKSLTPEGR